MSGKGMWVCSGCVIALLLGTCVATGGERKWLFGEGVEVTLTNGQSLGDALSHDEAVRQLAVARDANKANLRKITTLKGEYSFADAFRFEGEIPLINSVTLMKMDTAQYREMETLLNFSAPFSGPGYWEVTRGFARFELDCRSDLYHAFYSPAEPVAFLNSQEKLGFIWPTFGDPVHWTVTPDYSLEFYSTHKHGALADYPAVESVPPTGGRIVHKRSPDTLAAITRFFDPRSFFWFFREFSGN